MEREAGVCGQQGAGEFLRGADPQDPPQTTAQQWGGPGADRVQRVGGRKWRPSSHHGLGLPTPDRLRASLPAHCSHRGHPGHSHPCSPLRSDYCCHFPGLGRTRHSFKNISFAK